MSPTMTLLGCNRHVEDPYLIALPCISAGAFAMGFASALSQSHPAFHVNTLNPKRGVNTATNPKRLFQRGRILHSCDWGSVLGDPVLHEVNSRPSKLSQR